MNGSARGRRRNSNHHGATMSAESTKQLEQVLRSVAGRLRSAALRPQFVRALTWGAAVALVPALVRLVTGNLWWAVAALAVLVGFPLFVLVRAWAARPDLRRA